MGLAVFLIILSCGAVLGQPRFEVASLKPSNGEPIGPFGTDGGPGTRYPERFATSATLMGLLAKAFAIRDSAQIKGPGWMSKDEYAVDARVPPGTTREDFQLMLQNLLIDRFSISYHHETIMLPVYELIVAKGGVKFQESLPSIGETKTTPLTGNDREGFPKLPPGVPGLAATYSMSNGHQQSRWRAQEQTMEAFARMLSGGSAAGGIVVDKTGLSGKYDFTLFFDVPIPGSPALPPGAPIASSTLTVFDALELQLGLKLIDSKASFDKIVIDGAERMPKEN